MTNEEHEFIQAFLKFTDEEISQWYDMTDDEAHTRVGELLTTYKAQLEVKKVLLTDPEVFSADKANDYLKKFRL